MDSPSPDSLAAHFARLNGRRRAVRRFSGRPVSDATLLDICREAQLAPSSRNSQPYRFLCVRSPALKARLAPLCNDQAAARTAAALVVVVAGRALAMETLHAWNRHLAGDCGLDPRSVAHHRAELKESRLFLRIGAWPVWSLVVAVLTLLHPTASLLPLGRAGVRHWTARSALFAAQTFLLAASAYGLDTCPMEGFNAARMARALRLPRDHTIPLVIAVGYAAPDARREPRWRKPAELAVKLL
ncbi:MAG TPA: nitroreductase family protein [Gemmatimonadaceae bacterium]|nr:nitroreductase family protein [Gemmatimonadaceae bacterium]